MVCVVQLRQKKELGTEFTAVDPSSTFLKSEELDKNGVVEMSKIYYNREQEGGKKSSITESEFRSQSRVSFNVNKLV